MQIKLVNLNIWLGGKLFNSMLNFLEKENADIVTLQEVYNGEDDSLPKNQRTIKVIRDKLKYPFINFSPCFQDLSVKGKVDRGNAIFSRFPIIATNSFFYEREYGIYSENNPCDFEIFPRALQHAAVSINNGIVNVFNTQGIWGLDGKDNERRLNMSRIIIKKIKNKENVILTGDFNLQPNTKTVKNIERYLKNVFKNELKSTFNMKRKTNPGYATAVVDMVFVSKNIKVISHNCSLVDVSDHLPLVCVFDLPV